MDRDLRLRAPHRRTARPADPPRQHPRDERRELSPRQQHCPKAATKVLRSDRSFWPKEANAPWHAPAIGKRARHGAGHCHLAWFCAAAWPDFAPPLTNDLSFQLWTSRNFPPLEEQLRTLKSIGYTDVQPYHDQYNDPQAFKATLDEIGLTAKTGHFDINMIRSDFDRTVAAAKALGMKLVVAPFLKPDQRPTDRAGWETFGAELAG